MSKLNIDVKELGVLVTGGGKGIGKAMSEGFASSGAKVVIADIVNPNHVPKNLDSTDSIRFIKMDVADPDSVQGAVERVTAVQNIDVLINCAGIIHKATAEDMAFAEWRKVLDINLTGTMLCVKAVVPKMKSKGSGRIISLSSMQAYMGTATYGAYTASKAGLCGVTRVWASELAPHGITVNTLCPSFVNTPMIEEAIDRFALEKQISRAESYQQFVSQVPQKRILDPEEIVFTALFLASPLAQSITGQNILTAGGTVMN